MTRFCPGRSKRTAGLRRQHAPALMMGPMRWFEGAVPEPGLIPESISCVRYEDYFAKERVVDVSASAIVVRRRAMESVGGWEGFPRRRPASPVPAGDGGSLRPDHGAEHDVASIRTPDQIIRQSRTDHQRRRMADRKRQARQVSRRGRTTARATRVHRGHRDPLGSDARTVGRSRSCAPIRRQALVRMFLPPLPRELSGPSKDAKCRRPKHSGRQRRRRVVRRPIANASCVCLPDRPLTPYTARVSQ